MNEYGEVIIYQTDDGLTKLNVSLQNETVWLTIDQMAELFQRDKSTISRHINKIFKEGELVREATVAFFAPLTLMVPSKSLPPSISIIFIYILLSDSSTIL